jgi:hypothetical protein
MRTNSIYKLLLLFLLLSNPFKSNAQTAICGYDSISSLLRTINPNFDIENSILKYNFKEYKDYINSQNNTPQSINDYYIPVVFHVIYDANNPSINNISYQQIQSQLDQLNLAFSSGIAGTPGYALDYNIRFCFATEPSNSFSNGENGIVRYPIQTSQNYNLLHPQLTGIDIASIGNLINSNSIFPSSKYLNIVTVADIGGQVGGYSIIGLYSPINFGLDGIILRSDVCGYNVSNGNPYNLKPSYDKGGTLSHEVGHFLSLDHTFNNGCAGTFGSNNSYDPCSLYGDGICDTPPTTVQYWSCNTIPPVQNCTLNYSNGSIGNIPLTENFMSYSEDCEWTCFTPEQGMRFHFILDGSRTKLCSEINLGNTGIMGDIAGGSCLPPQLFNDIIVNNSIQCAGNGNIANIIFSNPTGPSNFNSAISWQWSFPGSLSSTGNNSSTAFANYDLPGTYKAILTVTDINGLTSSNDYQFTISTCGLPTNPSQSTWCYQDKCNLSFNTGNPIFSLQPSSIGNPSTSIRKSQFSSASISDEFGNLLFYTDGVTVWNKNHIAFSSVLNGSLNQGGATGGALQGVVIVPDPNNKITKNAPNPTNNYFIISMNDFSNGGSNITSGISYSVIDMNLNNGLGDFVKLNQAFPSTMPLTNALESVSAVPHCNGYDYWIVTHGIDGSYNDKLLAYLLTANGFVACSVSQSFPMTLTNSVDDRYSIEFAPDLTTYNVNMIVNYWSTNSIYFYNFNSATGIITTPSIGPSSVVNTSAILNFSFSPNSKYLYGVDSYKLYQYDISNLAAPPLLSNLSINGNYHPTGQIQLGPDNRIYFTDFNAHSKLGVIQNPNVANIGNACGITITSSSSLTPQRSWFSLPNMIDSKEQTPLSSPIITFVYASCSDITFNINNCYASYQSQWDFGDGNIGTTTSSTISNNYASQGPYQVSVVFSIGGYQLPPIIVSVYPYSNSLPTINGPSTLCLGSGQQSATYSVPYISGATYSWSVSNGASILQDPLKLNNAFISSNSVSTVVVTVSINIGNNCIVSNNINVDFINCCPTIPGATSFTNQTFTSGTNYNSQTIELNGTTTISGTVSFNSCTLIMAPNSVINLDVGDVLIIDNTEIRSCTNIMWEGIKLNGNGSEISITNSIIKNAKIAVYFSPLLHASIISNSTFDLNYISLFIDGQTNNGTNIYGNYFQCTGGTELYDPYLGQRSKYHIFIKDVNNIKIGDENQAPNYFGNPTSNVFESSYGIYGVNSNATIFNNVFSNINDSPGLNKGRSSAIYFNRTNFSSPFILSPYTVEIGNSSILNSKNTFNQCQKSIELLGMNCLIDGNKILNNSSPINEIKFVQSILIRNGGRFNAKISNNVIENFDKGVCIDVSNNVLSSVAIVENNYINCSPSTNNSIYSAAIRIADPYIFSGSGGNGIYNNSNPPFGSNITKKGIHSTGQYCIHVTKSNVAISENKIYMDHLNSMNNPTTPWYGIRFDNCAAPNLSCNLVSGLPSEAPIGTSQPQNFQRRHAITSNMTTLYSYCNKTDFTEVGFEFLSDCKDSEIKGNTIGNHNIGFQLGADFGLSWSTGIIGEQSYYFDPISNQNSTNGNRFEGVNGSGIFNNSSMHSNNSDAGFYIYNSDPNNYPSPNPPFTKYKNPNYTNTVTQFFPQYNPNITNYFLCDPNCQNISYSFNDNDINEEIVRINNLLNQINSKEDELLIEQRRKAIYLILKNNQQMLVNNQIITDFYTRIENNNTGKLLEVNAIMKNMIENSDGFIEKFNLASDLNNSIITNTVYEFNSKLMNRILLRKYSNFDNIEFNNDETSTIENIAFQCPFIGGDAVYQARSLYWTLHPETKFSDYDLCLNGAYFRLKDKEHSNTLFSLQPNPTKNSFEINYRKIDEGNLILQILDIAGKILKVEEVDGKTGSAFINTFDLKDGLYFVKLYSNDNSFSQVEKLVIAK